MTARRRGRGNGRRTAMAGPPRAERSWLPVVGGLAVPLLVLAPPPAAGPGAGRRAAHAAPAPLAQGGRGAPGVGRRAVLPLSLAAARAPAPGSGPGSAEASPTPAANSGVAAGTLAPATPPEPGHELDGYVPYWEMDDSIAEHL